MKISDVLTPEDLQILTSSLADSRASRSAFPESVLAHPTIEEICSLSLPDSSKTNDLAILSLRMFPDCWGSKKGGLSPEVETGCCPKPKVCSARI